MTRLYRMLSALCGAQTFISVFNWTCNCCVALSLYSSVRNFLMLSFHSQLLPLAPSLQFFQPNLCTYFSVPICLTCPTFHIPSFTIYNHVGWNSIVDIVTCYGLDGPQIESEGEGGGKIFLYPSRLALGPTQPPV